MFLSNPTWPDLTICQARAIEYMIVDALLAAEPIMRFADHVTNPEKYLRLTDSIVEMIQMSDDEVNAVPPLFSSWD